jgi:hypothetical protein
MYYRSIHERRAYAARRASLAVCRMIHSQALSEKLKASRWAELWGTIAGIRASRRG